MAAINIFLVQHWKGTGWIHHSTFLSLKRENPNHCKAALHFLQRAWVHPGDPAVQSQVLGLATRSAVTAAEC